MFREYVSKTEAWAENKKITFDPWVPAVGPTGRRNVIVGITVKANLSLTIATAVLLGEDVAKCIARFRLCDIGGERINLTGEELRVLNHLLLPSEQIFEAADYATGTPTTGEFYLYIPLAKPYAIRPFDFAIPADVMAQIELTCHSNTDMDLGSSTVEGTTSTTFKLIAHVREEDTVEFKARDYVTSMNMQTQTQAEFPVNGGYLAEVAAYVSGAQGGGAMTNWTAHRIDVIQPDELEDADMIACVMQKRAVASHGATSGGAVFDNPFTASTQRARAVHLLPIRAKLTDHPFVEKSILVRVTTGVASSKLIGRTIIPRNEVVDARTGQLYRVAPGSLRVKTEGKSRRNRKAWGPKFKFLCVSGKANSL